MDYAINSSRMFWWDHHEMFLPWQLFEAILTNSFGYLAQRGNANFPKLRTIIWPGFFAEVHDAKKKTKIPENKIMWWNVIRGDCMAFLETRLDFFAQFSLDFRGHKWSRISRVLFRKRELTEFCAKLGEFSKRPRWVRFDPWIASKKRPYAILPELCEGEADALSSVFEAVHFGTVFGLSPILYHPESLRKGNIFRNVRTRIF